MSILLSTIVKGDSSAAPAFTDNRDFKRWQDWYSGVNPNHPIAEIGNVTDSSRMVEGVAKNRMKYTDTFTVPTGVSKVRITVIAGGGGGGRYQGSYYGSSGGGGGGCASGEFTVSAGDVLDITCGTGGPGGYPSGGTMNGINGGTSSVTASSGSGGSAAISVSASGGTGGNHSNGSNTPAGSGSISGSSLVAGTNRTYGGGNGGSGSVQAIGWGPEGYSAGGGGAAGTPMDTGGTGGDGNGHYGYSWCSGGGGGAGASSNGDGGHGSGSRTASAYYSWAGGGGGTLRASDGHGSNGIDNTSNPPETSCRGGHGYWENSKIAGYTRQWTQVQDSSWGVKCDYPIQQGYPTGGSQTGWKEFGRMAGARYGDGENINVGVDEGDPVNSGVTWDAKLSQFGIGTNPSNVVGMVGFKAGKDSTVTGVSSMSAKNFNGVLGRMQGGGGAPGCTKDQSGTGGASAGGPGGTGGGGGGSGGHTTTGQGSNWRYVNATQVWSPVDLAFRPRFDESSSEFEDYTRLSGQGGPGGAFGGGGGSGFYGAAGSGGIGAGGGGCGGHYSGSSYNGSGGDGGPGYVLIEW